MNEGGVRVRVEVAVVAGMVVVGERTVENCTL